MKKGATTIYELKQALGIIKELGTNGLAELQPSIIETTQLLEIIDKELTEEFWSVNQLLLGLGNSYPKGIIPEPEYNTVTKKLHSLQHTKNILKDYLKQIEQRATEINQAKTLEEIKDNYSNNENKAIIQRRNEEPKAIKLKFSNPEIKEKFFDAIKGFFEKKENELWLLLQGERMRSKLEFPGQANQFVELFRRLVYNGYLLNNYTQVKQWICENFKYPTESGGGEYKEQTVDGIIRGKAEPAKSKRLLKDIDWLPHKSKKQIEDEKEIEDLE